ncbi:chromodomain helicase DNA binding protein CHD1/SWI2/SNF2 [Toxoplasma gondii GAB2-2007-GAL-DOM2]|uniref:Chromodomain helicase DNA binding protein CHD1/SWI2/SNF2 n=4 Tax=Toxoplasma gondii TaxID=5811 RepID=S7W7H2_TOXGG|nr:chromodomain helicase DNA binding protein CHD1/SWI2/SNF2 [Toxoplasma gondii GT1]KFG33827.1 chromodomain helicase DNA binding protein CHD1/SWI2/SNF2 [Toxoplasma gondii GAB2-2007-GAL-DOM2]KFG38023.1 chromodomain helicase DNA binding protein CHD1/SWI2/SNF2 [Toxoplasma gondii FOU]
MEEVPQPGGTPPNPAGSCPRPLESQGTGFGLMSAQAPLPSQGVSTAPQDSPASGGPVRPGGHPSAHLPPHSLQFLHLKQFHNAQHAQNMQNAQNVHHQMLEANRSRGAPLSSHIGGVTGAKPQTATPPQQQQLLLQQRHQLLVQQRVQQDHLRFQQLQQHLLVAGQHAARGQAQAAPSWPAAQPPHGAAAQPAGAGTPGSFGASMVSATGSGPGAPQFPRPLRPAGPPAMTSSEALQTGAPASSSLASVEPEAASRVPGPDDVPGSGTVEEAQRTLPTASAVDSAGGAAPSATPQTAVLPTQTGPAEGRCGVVGFQMGGGNAGEVQVASAMQRQRQLLQHQQLLQFQQQTFAQQNQTAGTSQRAPNGPNGVGPGLGFFGGEAPAAAQPGIQGGAPASVSANSSGSACATPGNPLLLQQQLLQQQLLQQQQLQQQNSFLTPHQLLQLQQLQQLQQRQNMYLRHLQASTSTSTPYGFPGVMTPPTAAAAAAAALAASAAKPGSNAASTSTVNAGPQSRRSAAAAAALRMRQFAAAENATDEEFFDVGAGRSQARKVEAAAKTGGTASRSRRSRQQAGGRAADDGDYYASHSISRQNSGIGAGMETGGVQLRQRRATARSGRYSEMLGEDEEEEEEFFEEEDDDDDDGARRRRNQQKAATASCRAQQLRASDAQQQTGGVDRVLDSRVNEDGVEEFFIKWLGRSHLHNSWMTYEELMPLLGIKKVDNFIKRREKRQQAAQWMTPDELEQQEIERQMQRQMDEDALIAERLLCKWQDQATGEWLYIVKWRSCPYDQCTQETEKALLEHNFGHLMEELDARTERINRKVAASMHPGAFRPITATPFDPYLETPFYMRREVAPDPDSVDEDEDKTGISTNSDEGKEKPSADVTNGAVKLKSEQEGEKGEPGEEKAGEFAAVLKAEKKENSEQCFVGVDEGGVSKAGDSAGSETAQDKPLQKKLQVLRDYQMFGVNWILSRLKRGVSVLLADEMGLGKTVQTIGVTGHLLFREQSLKPILIFAPQSTIDNWMREFHRWLPQANVVCFHGNASAREIIKNYELQRVSQQRPSPPVFKFDVCVTTPSILNCAADAEYLKRIHWGLLVVDEAHQLKNINSKRFIELSLFLVDHKLFLSGTPLHNNLEELWNLLHFLNPNIHRDCAEFKSRYHLVENHAEVGEQKTKQLAALQTELNGFILRRVKKDVEKSMPKKVESILRVEMSPLQLKFYRLILTKNFDLLAKKGGGNRSSLQNICMELKKVCNHPFLCQSPDEEEDAEEWRRLLVDGSAKMGLLDKLLKRLKEKGHRVLIFSQMVKMLNLLAEFLKMRGYKHQRLDGTMAKEVRRKAMEHFNAKNSEDFCFLLSTKAGGLGINLTSADTVIIFDSDWNPQNDLQAEARAHRIGQTRTVQIYRLVTKDSIEQTILERAKAKMVLDTLVVQGLNQRNVDGGAGFGAGGLSLTRDDLSRILKFGASKLWKQSQPKGCEEQKEENETEEAGEEKEQKEVDLDLILAEAEVTVTEAGAAGSGGLADSLLSSYQNIQEFKYEPTAPAKSKGRGRAAGTVAGAEGDEMNDAEFWRKCIPEEERLKMKKNKEEELIVYGKRKTRNNLFIGQFDPFGSPTDSHFGSGNLSERSRREGKNGEFTQDEGSDVSASGPFGGASASTSSSVLGEKEGISARERRGGRGRHRCVSPTSLTDKELHRLYRAMLKYGSPSVRTDDIIFDARLERVEKAVVLSTSQHIMSLCQQRLEEEIARQASRGGRRARRAPAERGEEEEEGRMNGEGGEDDADEEDKGTAKEGGRRESSYFTRLGDTRVNAFDLVERQHLLSLLHRVLCEQNPQVSEPWKLPTGPLPLPRGGQASSSLAQRDPDEGKGSREGRDKEGQEASTTSETLQAPEKEDAASKEEKPRREEDSRDGEEETKEGAGGRHATARIERVIREEVHGQGFLKLDLPSRVMSRLKNWSARDVQTWGEAEDRNLLIGAYKYGFGAWLDVCNDPNLELPQIRQIKFDKLKMRALRTLKLLEQDLQQEVGRCKRPRLPQRGNPDRGAGTRGDSPPGLSSSVSPNRGGEDGFPDDDCLRAKSENGRESAPGEDRESLCVNAPGESRKRTDVGRDEDDDDEDEDDEDDDERPKKRKKADRGADEEGRKKKKKTKEIDTAGLATLQGEDLRRACKKLLRSVKKKMKNLKKMKKDAQEKMELGADDHAALDGSSLELLMPLLLPIGEAITGIVRSLKDQGQPESLCRHVAGGCWQYVASLTAFPASRLSQAYEASIGSQLGTFLGGGASPSSLQSSHSSYSSHHGEGGSQVSTSGFPSSFPPADAGSGAVSLLPCSVSARDEAVRMQHCLAQPPDHGLHAEASQPSLSGRQQRTTASVSSTVADRKGLDSTPGGVSSFSTGNVEGTREEPRTAQAESSLSLDGEVSSLAPCESENRGEKKAGGAGNEQLAGQVEVDNQVFGEEGRSGVSPSRLLSPCRNAGAAGCPVSATPAFGNISNVARSS